MTCLIIILAFSLSCSPSLVLFLFRLNAFELNRYQQKFASELKAWRDTDLTNVDAFYFAAMDICQAQHTIAEQTVGWCQLGHLEQRVIVDNPERNKEFAKLRNKCIHQILSLVHKATFDSECASLWYEGSIQTKHLF